MLGTVLQNQIKIIGIKRNISGSQIKNMKMINISCFVQISKIKSKLLELKEIILIVKSKKPQPNHKFPVCPVGGVQ